MLNINTPNRAVPDADAIRIGKLCRKASPILALQNATEAGRQLQAKKKALGHRNFVGGPMSETYHPIFNPQKRGLTDGAFSGASPLSGRPFLVQRRIVGVLRSGCPAHCRE